MENLKRFWATFGASFVIVTSSQAATNIIDSTYGDGAGSFELGAFVRNGSPGHHMHLDTNSTTITGWTVGGAPGIGIDWVTMPDAAASQGIYSIDLSGVSVVPSVGSVSTIIPTISGVEYLISFDAYGGVEALPGFLTAGSLSQTFNAPGNPNPAIPGFATFNYSFTALSNSTTITFSSTPVSYGFGPVIDNVIVAIPEPSSSVLGCVFALGLTFRRKR